MDSLYSSSAVASDGLIRNGPRRKERLREVGRWFLIGPLMLVLLSGCASVGVHEQRLVSKPSMQFSRSVVFDYSSKVLPQAQGGLAVSGGAQASTCTSCR